MKTHFLFQRASADVLNLRNFRVKPPFGPKFLSSKIRNFKGLPGKWEFLNILVDCIYVCHAMNIEIDEFLLTSSGRRVEKLSLLIPDVGIYITSHCAFSMFKRKEGTFTSYQPESTCVEVILHCHCRSSLLWAVIPTSALFRKCQAYRPQARCLEVTVYSHR